MFVSFDVGLEQMDVEHRGKKGIFYKYWSRDFLDSDLWAYNDAPFLTTFKKLKSIYDDEYFSQNNVWYAECYLNLKYSKENLERYILEKYIFKNVNTIGPTTTYVSMSGSVLKNVIASKEAEDIIKKRYNELC
jgi:hypothetical protein